MSTERLNLVDIHSKIAIDNIIVHLKNASLGEVATLAQLSVVVSKSVLRINGTLDVKLPQCTLD